jgi:hypothetical protein
VSNFGDVFIKVEFTSGAIYLYTYDSTGMQDIERMKELAVAGEGLNSYISKYVRKRYASKLR